MKVSEERFVRIYLSEHDLSFSSANSKCQNPAKLLVAVRKKLLGCRAA
jgi:hypothetical protein